MKSFRTNMADVQTQQKVAEGGCTILHIRMQTRFPDKRSHWCKQSPMFFDEDQVFPLSGNRKTCYYSWVQVCHTRQDVVALVLSVNYACFVCLLQGIQIKSYMQNNVLQETDVLLHQLFWELPHIFMQYNIPGIIC